MKEYELIVLIHPDLEVDIEAPLKKVRTLITSNGGKITTEENWGKKKLAYRIKNQDFATYVYFDVTLPAESLIKISNTLNISDEVVRYLLVKVDVKGRKAAEEAKATEATEKTSERK
ncbi:30S ribosomal protein S6 [Candidatus Saccharibacteria bacterium CG11_big_fil_rev_8_21_14_0_20_41_19]|nr:30S ribosomal protein S6 [Candidatus Saccharibacteria bacterium]OIP85592.1 MAG: 30S ribosomal protein S6 [Candidatus Saccharibacteria bacterium CG2_30_41_52]PIQ70531.1 MAG: 30S ribosomal protein S6 [Candidatus Saccharibacteria bacterium CG11_big_fil_rev_8_21_14_0_20_41_19]PIZ60224.1 MAG: 30S ribosomal protein S6 [Candidatus Saccharibacteria bacterium CG_4_10_14_0_2_um_filter_41_11]PJC29354.1 MAG: 30S ribosomal protein S6 [Candidatus Saccharibacteria bacterium CG_4_9_14_0_2_um_filter_41_9]PJ